LIVKFEPDLSVVGSRLTFSTRLIPTARYSGIVTYYCHNGIFWLKIKFRLGFKAVMSS